MDADFEMVRQAVTGTELSDEARHTVEWCLGQLPSLYRRFLESYDSRHVEEIRRLVQGLLRTLAAQPHGPPLAEAIAGRLQALHERLGLRDLDLKPVARPRRRTRKVA
jgi:hypothetical protein